MMGQDEGSRTDRDLLSRLNALKKSTVDFDQKTYSSYLLQCRGLLINSSYDGPKGIRANAIDPLPAHALHSELLDRFKSLTGKAGETAGDESTPAPKETRADRTDEDQTIEELLADLGPSEQWEVGKTEHDEVEELLRAADTALKKQPDLEQVPGDEAESHKPAPTQLPNIDVSVFKPEPESDDDDELRANKKQVRDQVDQEADEVLKKLMDEVKYEQKHGAEEDAPRSEGSDHEDEGDSALDLPAAPSKALPDAPEILATDKDDDDLSARFASLSLPSVPSTMKSNAASKPKDKAEKFSDDEIDSWCIICSDDASLSCLGCDGDLYCTNCWIEGHRGEDAGYEERSHKAVQYVKGGGKKKQKDRRVMMGA